LRLELRDESMSGRSVAFQPGMVNGLYIADAHFVAPDPHGPVIGGSDESPQETDIEIAGHASIIDANIDVLQH